MYELAVENLTSISPVDVNLLPGKCTCIPVADLGEGAGDPTPPPLFWVKKEEMTEGKMAGRASKSRLGTPLAQGLDPPLYTVYNIVYSVQLE